MTNKDNYQKVGIEVDQQSFNQLKGNTDNILNDLQKLSVASGRTTDSMTRLSEVSKAIGREQTIQDLGKQYAQLGKLINDDTEALRQMRVALKEIDASSGEISRATHSFSATSAGGGDNQQGGAFNLSGLRRTGGALTQLGLGDIGQPIQQLGSLGQVVKELGLVSDATGVAATGAETGLAATAASLLPIAAVGAAVGVGLFGVGKALEAIDASTATATSGLKRVSDTLEQFDKITTGTSDNAVKSLTQLQSDTASLKRQRDELVAANEKTFQELAAKNGDAAARIQLSRDDTYNKSVEKIKKLNDQITENQDLVNRSFQEVQDGSTAAADAQEKQAKAAADLVEKSKAVQSNLTLEAQLSNLSVKAGQERLDALKDEQRAIESANQVLIDSGDKSATVTDQITANNKALADNAAAQKYLTETAIPAAKALENSAAALKKLDEAQKAHLDMLNKEAESVKKYNDAVQAANDTADQAKLAAAQKLNDALVNAAQAAVDAASKALETLQQKQSDNLTGLNRDLDKIDREAADKQLTDQIAAQKQERDDLQAHLTALQQIRDRDKGRERDDLLNRNYRDLFALKEQQNQDISTENDKYSKQEKARQDALKQQQSDDTRALQIQRRERLIAYQQANADAVKAYNIELAHAQEAKARAIQLAQQGYQKELAAIAKNNTDKLAALRAGEVAELKIITQSTQARQRIFLDELNQARQMLGQATSGQSGTFNSPQNIAQDTGFAYGGDPNYQRVKVNDGGRGQRESFNGVLLPRGLGLFIPMTSGRIDANGGAGGGVNYNPTFNITGPDPKTIADMIDARNMRFAKETFLK